MPVIELGEVTGTEAAEPAPGPRRLLPAPRQRRWWGLLLAGLLVLAGHASAPAGQPGVRLLWTGQRTPGDTVLVAGAVAYQISGGARAEVVAWSLADGSKLWRWGTDGHLITINPAPGGGPLLLAVDPVPASNAPAGMAARTTIALRAGTGAELWRRPGEPHRQAIGADSALLTEYDARDGIAGLTRVRLEDGTPVWDRTVAGPLQEVVVVPDEDRLITGTAAGKVTVRRYSDSTEIVSRTVPMSPVGNRFERLTAGNGLLVMLDRGADRIRGTAYRLDTLREVFPTGSDQGLSAPCGAVMCGSDNDGFFVYDPATGRELWRAGEVLASVITRDRILTDDPYDADHSVIDIRTGRRLTEDLYGWLVLQPTYDDSALLLRATKAPLGRTAVVRVDLRTGRSRVLGSVEPMPDQKNCQATPGYVVCLAWDQFVVAGVPR